jgi:hypothetical protein
MGLATRFPPKGQSWRELITTRMWDPQYYQPLARDE